MKTKSRGWINEEDDLVSASSRIELQMFIFSFIFVPAFSSEEGRGSKYLTVKSNLR